MLIRPTGSKGTERSSKRLPRRIRERSRTMARKKQRGNGHGTVAPRKNKAGKIIGYRGAFFGPDGKRRWVSAKTKTECWGKLNAAMTDADRGILPSPATLT